MELIEGDKLTAERCGTCFSHGRHTNLCDRPDATLGELRKALVPVKAFRTRCIQRGMPAFEIVEV